MSRHKTTASSSENAEIAAGEVGAVSARLSLPRDWARPFSVKEARAAAKILAGGVPPTIVAHKVLIVGIVLDLLPSDLTPPRNQLAKQLGISRTRLDDYEMVWEMFTENVRMDFVRRAVRIILASRGCAS